jgi:hypothetical protein
VRPTPASISPGGGPSGTRRSTDWSQLAYRQNLSLADGGAPDRRGARRGRRRRRRAAAPADWNPTPAPRP